MRKIEQKEEEGEENEGKEGEEGEKKEENEEEEAESTVEALLTSFEKNLSRDCLSQLCFLWHINFWKALSGG